MSLHIPAKYNVRTLRDVSTGIILLFGVAAVSVVIGVRVDPTKIGDWGSWLGAFISGIALVASAYAILIQARQGESSSWNIALGRLGEIYDQAFQDPRLAKIIAQPSDPTWQRVVDPDEINLSDEELVWLGGLFLAFEQIYVATIALSPESQRVWRLYLRNQLNKPFIRAAFVRDAQDAKDYHQEFWRFVRGAPSEEQNEGYCDYVIHPRCFNISYGKKSVPSITDEIQVLPFESSHGEFWLTIYKDQDVRQNMYAAPTDSVDSLIAYISNRKVFTVFLNQLPVGGFTISPEKDKLATFGIVIHPAYRGKGLAVKIMHALENEARKQGHLTLRGDVYTDNTPCIKTLEAAGFRKFIWLEKNISDPPNSPVK